MNNTDTTPPPADSKLIEKLKKLLRMGQSPNQHEAEMAMKIAQQLAIENKINLSLLNTDAGERGAIGESSTTHPRPVSFQFIAKILIRFFSVRVVTAGKTTILIGRDEDVETAQFIYEFLREAMANCWRDYQRKTSELPRARGAFQYGFYLGMSRQLNDNQTRATEEALARQAPGAAAIYALATVNDAQALAEYMKEEFPNTTKARARKAPDTDSNGTIAAGYKAGKETRICKPLTN